MVVVSAEHHRLITRLRAFRKDLWCARVQSILVIACEALSLSTSARRTSGRVTDPRVRTCGAGMDRVRQHDPRAELRRPPSPPAVLGLVGDRGSRHGGYSHGLPERPSFVQGCATRACGACPHELGGDGGDSHPSTNARPVAPHDPRVSAVRCSNAKRALAQDRERSRSPVDAIAIGERGVSDRCRRLRTQSPARA